jgi:hypothetical protein
LNKAAGEFAALEAMPNAGLAPGGPKPRLCLRLMVLAMAQVNAGHSASEPAKVGQIGSNRGGFTT